MDKVFGNLKSGRTRKRDLNENPKKGMDSDFVWKWICRALVVFLTVGWYNAGTEPSERWIGLIVILLGLNEFVNVKKKKDSGGEGYSIVLRKGKELSEREDYEEERGPSLFIDGCFILPPGLI